MTAQIILRIVGIITAGMIFVVGIVILLGLLMPRSIPENYRTILGIVMVGYGTYRLVMIWMKQRRDKRDQE